MSYTVSITRSAAKDIDMLAAYLLAEAGTHIAAKALADLYAIINSLAENPARGANPVDLAGISTIPRKQVLAGHYRVIYQIIGSSVFVEMVIDGRRNVSFAFKARLQSDF